MASILETDYPYVVNISRPWNSHMAAAQILHVKQMIEKGADIWVSDEFRSLEHRISSNEDFWVILANGFKYMFGFRNPEFATQFQFGWHGQFVRYPGRTFIEKTHGYYEEISGTIANESNSSGT